MNPKGPTKSARGLFSDSEHPYHSPTIARSPTLRIFFLEQKNGSVGTAFYHGVLSRHTTLLILGDHTVINYVETRTKVAPYVRDVSSIVTPNS